MSNLDFLKINFSCLCHALCSNIRSIFAELIINNNRVMAYIIEPDLCTACGTCLDECPVEAISEGDTYVIDPDLCTDCGACADVCPVEAIHPE